MRENVRSDGSSMARTPIASPANWSSTMDSVGNLFSAVRTEGRGGWVDLGTGLINVGGFGDINLQGNVKHNFTNFAPRLDVAWQCPDEGQS